MFCRKCGSRVSDNDIFCNNCGEKQSTQANSNNNQNINYSNSNKRSGFSASSLIIFIMFIINTILLVTSITTSGVKEMLKAPVGASNGLMILVFLVIACVCAIPQALSAILGIINLFVKKQILSVIIFVTSLISIISIIVYYSMGILVSGFGLNIILNVIVSIVALIKMLFSN